MNPLDLRGPEFLGFYVCFATTAIVVAWIVRRALDPGGAPPRVSDPYALALLRGGRVEAVKTALLALSEVGAVQVDATLAGAVAGRKGRPGLEAAVVRRFATRRLISGAAADSAVADELAAMERRLQAQGLLPDGGVRFRRALVFAATELLVVGAAVAKIVVALQRGRSNVEFLVVLAVVATIVAFILSFPRVTPRGRRLLDDLRTLFAPLRTRARTSAARTAPEWADDLAMIAAVYGPSMLPGGIDARRALWPLPTSTSSSDPATSSFFSSCGGGGACGGGGGGGGGCGGCGSS